MGSYDTGIKTLITLVFFLVFSVTIACSRQPYAGFEGEWVLDVDAVILQVESKLQGTVEPATLTDLRTKLEHERPRLLIRDGTIRMQIESASMELTHKVKEKLGSCLVVLVGDSTEVKYCLIGNDVLKQEKVNKSANDIAEIYKRIN